MALTTRPHLTPRLKKEQIYISIPPPGLHSVFYSELYLQLYSKNSEDKILACRFQSFVIILPFGARYFLQGKRNGIKYIRYEGQEFSMIFINYLKVKVIPLQARCGPEGG